MHPGLEMTNPAPTHHRNQRDGRFAPSPTGPLHLGSLRTALLAWLFARSQSARFLVRIEDLDPQRSRPEFERAQLEDLSALSLDWDEPPVRQSERLPLYERALAQLEQHGRLYPCFCTRAEIREAASAPHGALPGGSYPGTCRALSQAERERRRRAGRPFALRVRAEGERIAFADRLCGRIEATVDDFVVRRADGVPAYQLAVVVDDAAQGVGEVVRGDDLLDSTPRQILLARLLALPVPAYAHVPLVHGADGARLAKRSRPPTLADRREPPQLTLALLAHTLGLALDRDRVERPAELLDEFEPGRLPRQPSVLG
jgi:glutamyl-tRNA synthetase